MKSNNEMAQERVALLKEIHTGRVQKEKIKLQQKMCSEDRRRVGGPEVVL